MAWTQRWRRACDENVWTFARRTFCRHGGEGELRGCEVKPDPKMAKRFNWWWRDDDNSFVLTPKGSTEWNSRWDNDQTVILERFGAKITKYDEMHSHFIFWKGGFEKTAHTFELARRHNPKAKLPPWTELDGFQRSKLNEVFGTSGYVYVTRETTKA